LLYHKILYKIFCKVIYSSVEVLSLTFVFCCQISPIDDDDDGDDDVVVVLLTIFCSFLCAIQCINCCSVVENCTPKYSCMYVSPRRRRRRRLLHLLALAFFLLFLSEDDDDDDDAREIVIVEKEIGLRLASWELLRFQSGWWFWSLSGLYGSQQRISGERSASRGCRSWQSMWWKDQLERSVPWELHKQGWWSSRNKRTRAAATSLVWTWNPWTTLLTMLLLPSRKNRTPPPHLCQSKRNFLFVSSAILVAIENVTGGGSYNLVHFARLAKQQCALTICVLFLYLLLLQLGALSHMVGNSWSLLPYNSTTTKRLKEFCNWTLEKCDDGWMHACMQSFFLERKQNWHAFVLLQRNKVSESVIINNNPWDVCLCNREECCPRWERSCASSLSLSLSLSGHNLFACLVVVRSCLWKGNLYSSCVESNGFPEDAGLYMPVKHSRRRCFSPWYVIPNL